MKVVVVAFKVSEENAVYYRKVDLIDGKDTYNDHVEKLGETLLTAMAKGADFVSVRFVRGRLLVKFTDTQGKDLPPHVIQPARAVKHEDAPSVQFEEPCVCPGQHDRCEAWSVKNNSKHRDLIIGHCSGCELRTTGFATEKPIQSARLITDPWAHDDVSA